MSAAAPLPPPGVNGGGQGAYPNSRPSSSSGSTERPFKHIQDLNLAALSGFERNASVHQLLSKADEALKLAQSYLDFRRANSQELSYVEYMRASEIVVEVIPRNKGWPEFEMERSGGGMQKYQLLQKRINGESERYAKIKEIIVNNNKRFGVLPASGGGGGHVRAESELHMNGGVSNGSPSGPKVRPTPSPKPENLHGKAIPVGGHATNNAAPAENLNDRFAKLRMNGATDTNSRPNSRSSNFSDHSSPISKVGTNDFSSRTSFDSLFKTPSTSSAQPRGPRPMPPPPVPGKLPLDTSIASSLPKEPSPTYSPARNMQTTENMSVPRHTPRSLAQSSTRRTSLAPSSSASTQAPNGAYQSDDYFPTATRVNSTPCNQIPRRKSLNVPRETRMSNERLYDSKQRFNILLIDFRPREQFDQGHIYSRTIMCVDPIHVSQGMSADQLLERMVISPDFEQDMFMNRDKFDLVVYYDTQTQSETYLTRPNNENETKLKHLHEALFDFNEDKPLQHPPILLIGGIEAWVDLVGPQALISSNTAAKARQGRQGLQRRPAMTNGASQLRNPKRRLRDYNPLDDEEGRKWQERARAESVVLPTPPVLTDENGQPLEPPEDGDEKGSTAIEEFLARFPEAASLDKYAFAPFQPSRPAPDPPPKVPLPSYPPPAPPASYPSRPPPTAPRTSYTGVSERAASQTVPVARSTAMAPYIPPKYLATNLRLPKTGLVNFRFTCYMNATLQALSATTPLSIFFLDDQWRGLLQRDNWKGTRGVLPELYSNLVRSLWKGDVDYIRPTTFRTFCGRLKSEWGRDDQEQDAKEFFDFLVDGLHEDLNGRWAKPPLKELTPADEAHRERMPKPYVAKIEWGRFTHRDQSFITSLFGGQYSSRLQCLTCGHTSTTYDAFYSLSVEIPRLQGRNPTLNDCLKSYCSEEVLKGGDQARCDRCKEFRDSTKQITITRAPQFLVVHFKRFQTIGRSSKKINTAIDFPLENFDLEPYMLPQPTPAEIAQIDAIPGSDHLKTDASMTPPYTYDCYGVIRHLGPTLEEGHYKALVKDRARKVWRCFDDRIATDFVPGEREYRGGGDLRNGQAYIVFYQRGMGAGPPMQMVGPPGGVGKM